MRSGRNIGPGPSGIIGRYREDGNSARQPPSFPFTSSGHSRACAPRRRQASALRVLPQLAVCSYSTGRGCGERILCNVFLLFGLSTPTLTHPKNQPTSIAITGTDQDGAQSSHTRLSLKTVMACTSKLRLKWISHVDRFDTSGCEEPYNDFEQDAVSLLK